MKDTLIIVNPASGGGRTGRGWGRTAADLRAAGLDFDVAMTSCAGEAIDLARRAVGEGRPLIVAAGGDGTINEVVNGFFARGEPVSTQSRLGVLQSGTGGDMRRTLGLPLDVAAAAAVLKAGRARRLDTGRVTFALPGGGELVRHFINVASAGIGGEVVRLVDRGPRLLNGEITFSVASLRALLRWRHRPMRVEIDGEAREFLAEQVAVANCQYYGGGMRVAPVAEPDDGLLDVVMVGDMTLWENVRGLGAVREGRHLGPGFPKISHARGRRVAMSSSEPVLVEVDGEQPGSLPAVFEVQPGTIEVVCP